MRQMGVSQGISGSDNQLPMRIYISRRFWICLKQVHWFGRFGVATQNGGMSMEFG